MAANRVSGPLWCSIDIGGTNSPVALGTSGGEIVAERSIPTRSEDPADKVLGRIGDLIEELSASFGVAPAAIGAGVPGLADLRTGQTLFLPNLPGNWRGVPVAGILAARFACPVYLLNDVRMATLGELTFGLGRGVRDMVFLAVGTGIGGGIALGGRLRLGLFGAAGEMGHQTIAPEGPLCGCGNRGCVEALASGPAIAAEGVRLMRIGLAPRLHDLVGGDAGAVTPKVMAAAADAGDSAVRDAIERAASMLGIAVANVVTTLHPELVVLGGGVPGIGEWYLDRVRATVSERVRMFPVDDVRIERSLLGDKAGLYGGIALAQNGNLEDNSWTTLTQTSRR